MALDYSEIVSRLIKYLVEALVIIMVAFIIPGKKLTSEEILMLGMTAASTFALLDFFSPSIGSSARQGLGFSVGAGLVGGLPVAH
jgi:ABC-type Co2+ transport system permease subunit